MASSEMTPLPIEPPVIELADPLLDQSAVTDALLRYECRACGYTYEPAKGDQQGHIPAGTSFDDLPATWRCPVCASPIDQFDEVGQAGKPSGFQENLRYGMGVNTLTPGQKNILIFMGLGIGFLFLMSFYFIT